MTFFTDSISLKYSAGDIEATAIISPIPALSAASIPDFASSNAMQT